MDLCHRDAASSSVARVHVRAAIGERWRRQRARESRQARSIFARANGEAKNEEKSEWTPPRARLKNHRDDVAPSNVSEKYVVAASPKRNVHVAKTKSSSAKERNKTRRCCLLETLVVVVVALLIVCPSVRPSSVLGKSNRTKDDDF